MIGETPSVLLIGSWSRLREVVGLAAPRFWESEMEGFVSNLMVCNLAYNGKLEELKKEILADKSLATRTDQVKRRWGPSSGGSCDVEQRGCLARPSGVPAGPLRARSPPLSLHPQPSGRRMGRSELVPQT